MKVPTLEELREVFNDNAATAKIVLVMTREELEQMPEAQQRLRECFNPPPTEDLRLHVLNTLAETHGVEGFDEHGEHVEYLNAGDTYAATLVFFRGDYSITCYGDVVEQIEREAYEAGEARCCYCGEW